MKAQLGWATGLVLGLGLFLIPARADVDFSAGVEIDSPMMFYSPLEPYGTWVVIGSYGRCWHPTGVAADWRPYCVGHWEWTDCGWYWVSDEPWAWACYHYGSWVDEPEIGWCWIPGTEWAPAWVVWRESPDYIGWAPCGPARAVPAPGLFVFVHARDFDAPIRRSEVIVNERRVFARTRVINNIRRETREVDGARRRVMVNTGPGVDPIQRATGRRVAPHPIAQVLHQTPVPKTVPRRAARPPITRPAVRPPAKPRRPPVAKPRSRPRPALRSPKDVFPPWSPARRRVTPPVPPPARHAQPPLPRPVPPPTGPAQRPARGIEPQRPPPGTARPEHPTPAPHQPNGPPHRREPGRR